MKSKTKIQLINELEAAHRRITELEIVSTETGNGNESHYKTIYYNNPLGMLTLNGSGIVTSANSAFYKFFDLSQEKIIKKAKIKYLDLLK